MKNIKQDILKDIEKGEIKMASRLSFLAHDYFFWTIGALTTILGGLAISVVLHRIATYQIRPVFAEPESISVFVQTLPYLWLIAFLALLGLAWFNVHKTSRAYKMRNITLIISVFAGSMLLGLLLFAGGFGQAVDERSQERIPLLKKEFQNREELRQKFIERRPGFDRGNRMRPGNKAQRDQVMQRIQDVRQGRR